jgi:HTH-type transcriptional regulator / antitoxin HipB
MKELAPLIRFHRVMAGFTQKELAERAGIGKSTLVDIEKGKPTVQLDSILKVLEILKIEIVFIGPMMKEFETFQSKL